MQYVLIILAVCRRWTDQYNSEQPGASKRLDRVGLCPLSRLPCGRLAAYPQRLSVGFDDGLLGHIRLCTNLGTNYRHTNFRGGARARAYWSPSAERPATLGSNFNIFQQALPLASGYLALRLPLFLCRLRIQYRRFQQRIPLNSQLVQLGAFLFRRQQRIAANRLHVVVDRREVLRGTLQRLRLAG